MIVIYMVNEMHVLSTFHPSVLNTLSLRSPKKFTRETKECIFFFFFFIKPKSRKCFYLISLCSEFTQFHDPNLARRKAGNFCALRMRKTHGEYLALSGNVISVENVQTLVGVRIHQEGVQMKIQNLKIYAPIFSVSPSPWKLHIDFKMLIQIRSGHILSHRPDITCRPLQSDPSAELSFTYLKR